jgi:hypothetical protein
MAMAPPLLATLLLAAMLGTTLSRKLHWCRMENMHHLMSLLPWAAHYYIDRSWLHARVIMTHTSTWHTWSTGVNQLYVAACFDIA